MPELEVGTGDFDFVSLHAGEGVPIVCGPQGGHHVLVSIRARGLAPGPVRVEIQGRRTDRDELVWAQMLAGIELELRGEWQEIDGVLCILPPSLVAELAGNPLPLELRARIVDEAGRSVDAILSILAEPGC